MHITDSENILKVLSSFNPWWKTDVIKSVYAKPFKRLAYMEALKILSHPSIRRFIVLSGARRVGKTTIVYQLIEKLLSQGVEARRIVFVSFDHPLLKLCQLQQVLDIYRENVCGEEQVYYFFDEIQYAQDWDKWLKVIYDMQADVRLVATGSASPILLQKNTESGVGRWTVVPVPTLSFYEYCHLIEAEGCPLLAPNIRPTAIVKMDKTQMTNLFLQLVPMQKHFSRYMQMGGFPELALSDDEYMAGRVMREDVVDKVIKRDIPDLYKIRNASDLEKIFLYLCYHSSNIINIETITKELNGVSRPTVQNYIQYLESANLIYISTPVDKMGKKILKGRPKIYIADAAIRNAVLMQEDLLTNTTEMGIMAETAVYKHVAAFYYQQMTKVGYYRSGSGHDKEIDITVEFPNGRILLEVKYRENAVIHQNDAISQQAPFANAAIVVTKRETDYGVQKMDNGAKLLKIPAYAFLYLLGHAEKEGYIAKM